MKTIVLVCFLYLTFSTFSQENKSKNIEVNWLSFEEANKMFLKKQKPIMVFLYDKNKDSSSIMLNETFGLEEVANYVNILFYPIKLEIHSKDTISFFDGTKFSNTEKNGAVHDLAFKLSGGVPQSPSLVVFSKEAVGTVYPGFKDRDHIFPVLIYYSENAYKTTEYTEFEKYYLKTYPPGRKQIMTRVLVKWKTMEEAFELNKKNPKKIFINLYNNYNISCTMMSLKTFNNPKVAEYLNKNFYCVNFSVKTKDTIKIFDQIFINEEASHGYHQLAISFLSGKMNFPAFLIFDEKSKSLDKKQEYMTPEVFEPIIKFVGSNAYKKQNWDNFIKSFTSTFFEDSDKDK